MWGWKSLQARNLSITTTSENLPISHARCNRLTVEFINYKPTFKWSRLEHLQISLHQVRHTQSLRRRLSAHKLCRKSTTLRASDVRAVYNGVCVCHARTHAELGRAEPLRTLATTAPTAPATTAYGVIISDHLCSVRRHKTPSNKHPATDTM